MALVLRVGWAMWTTEPPQVPIADTAKYLTAANDLAHGDTPRRHGLTPTNDPKPPSASTAVGYPLLLTPAVWIADATGVDHSSAASAVNVGLATLNVVLVAMAASVWISPRARNPAAWILAIAPSHIYFVSVAMSETAYTTATLVGVLVGGKIVQDSGERRPSRAAMVGFGAFCGWAALVNPGGLLLLAVPILAARARRGSWHRSFRRLGFAVLGAMLVLLPWTVRNGTQIGVWTPMPTSNAMAVCFGHNDRATGADIKNDPAVVSRCFTYEAPVPGEDVGVTFARWLSGNPDEREWYYRNHREAVQWAAQHPRQELTLAFKKLWVTLNGDTESLTTVVANGGVTSEHELRGALAALANAWYVIVLTLAAAGLVLSPAARRALPIWGLALLNLLGVIGIHGSERFHHASVALAVVLASATVVIILDAVRERPNAAAADGNVIEPEGAEI